MTLSRVVLVLLAAMAVACGGSTPTTPGTPSGPSAPVVNSTTYSGLYKITSCGSLCGYVGEGWPFTLTVTRNGAARTAVLRTEPWGLEATLTGTAQPTGPVTLKGTAPAVSADVIGADVDVVLQEGVSGITGSFS